MIDRATLIGRAREMRHDPTDAEKIMWRLLRSRTFAGLKFRRQAPLGGYIADFACFDPRVIVECDGGQHGDNRYDAARDAWFEQQGFKVLRFWNDAVLRETDGVARDLLVKLGKE